MLFFKNITVIKYLLSSFALFVAMFCTIWTGGPALGYFLGGIAMEYYVDFERIPKDKIPDGISTFDPRWIGAWWIGFLASAIALFLLSIPAIMLPKDPSVNVCVKHQEDSATPAEAKTLQDTCESDSKEKESSIAIKASFKENAKGKLKFDLNCSHGSR